MCFNSDGQNVYHETDVSNVPKSLVRRSDYFQALGYHCHTWTEGEHGFSVTVMHGQVSVGSFRMNTEGKLQYASIHGSVFLREVSYSYMRNFLRSQAPTK